MNKLLAKIIIGVSITLLILIVLFFALWTESDETTDISDYSKIFGENGKHNNIIFPSTLPSSAKIENFHYYYYNPFDPNYVSYLVYTCNDEDFKNETIRLDNLTSSDNYLIYGATGFNYDISAIIADSYYGYLYALEYPEENKIIYVEINFCNNFSDIDYEKIILPEHLPINFDATRKSRDH